MRWQAGGRGSMHLPVKTFFSFLINLIRLIDGRKVIGNVRPSSGFISLLIGLKSHITTFLLYNF